MGLGIDFDGWDLKIINGFKIEPFQTKSSKIVHFGGSLYSDFTI